MASIGDQLLQPEAGWKRIDDTDTHFKYIGSGWVTSTNQYLYNGNEHATNRLGDTVSFKFYGTKLRVLSGKFTNNPNNIDINIDGTSYKYDQSGTSAYKAQIILFEKLGLDLGVHTVIITSPSSSLYIALDCIDIDDTGYLVATVGEQLLQPENGWKRIDDRNELINYYGEWLYQAGTENANGGSTIINPSASLEQIQSTYAEFYFFGSKIRIINAYYEQSSMKYTMEIDGEKIITSSNGTLTFQCIISEKLNLDKKPHKVKIYSGDDKRISIDAIDIDEDGYLLTEEEYLENTKPPVKPEPALDFPVKVSDDTITSESDVATYAATIINGEKQLLVVDKLKSMYITNGSGGYSQVSKVIDFDNKETLDKFNINDNNKLTWNDSILYTEEDIKALNIKATNIVVNIKDGDINTTKTLQEVLDDILANSIQPVTKSICGEAVCGKTICGSEEIITTAICGTAICGNTTCGDL